MKNGKKAMKKNCEPSNKNLKFFYTIEDFPKFRILEENYNRILEELMTVIGNNKQINLIEKKIEKINSENNECDKPDLIINENQDKQSIKENRNFIKNVKDLNENNKEDISIIDNLGKNKIHNKKQDYPKKEKLNAYKNKHKDSEKSDLKQNNQYEINIIKDDDKELSKIDGNNNINNDVNINNINNKSSDEDKNFQSNNFSNEIETSTTFEPWVEKNLYQESNEDGWEVAPLMIGGEKIQERWDKFPLLTSLVQKISGVCSVSFSLLKPGTHIVPHKGYDDYSEKMYRYHMGIMVPEGDVAIRVEKDIRKWENGKSFVFDDFLIHEAWNFTCKNRIVLIIDFLKDETKIPNGIKFFDANFNKSIKGYLQINKNNDEKDIETTDDNFEN